MFNFNLFDPFLMLLYGIGEWCLDRPHMLIICQCDPGLLKILGRRRGVFTGSVSVYFQQTGKTGCFLRYMDWNGFLLVWGTALASSERRWFICPFCFCSVRNLSERKKAEDFSR